MILINSLFKIGALYKLFDYPNLVYVFFWRHLDEKTVNICLS